MVKPIIFLVVTILLILVSRKSLLHPSMHGFYRFFAWESILIFTLLKLDVWFSHAFAWYQIISWLFLIISLFLVLHGVWLLQQAGRRDSRRQDESLFDFEKTAQLVTIGAYRYIRHPLYSSLLFLTWGIFFKYPDWPGGILGLFSSLLLFITALKEEAEDIRYFGQAYRDYMCKTKMFIPFIF